MLAAGAGRRYGGPKALAHGGAWLRDSLAVLRDGGCEPVRVVLGAGADEAVALLPDPAMAVIAADWDRGMSASLRAGLAALTTLAADCDAALVHLVDLPDVGADVIRRVATLAGAGAGAGARAAGGPGVVARATYLGRPGHPVLLGRDHWPAITAIATGDHGARDWLATRADLVTVECGDLARGHDRDTSDTGLA